MKRIHTLLLPALALVFTACAPDPELGEIGPRPKGQTKSLMAPNWGSIAWCGSPLSMVLYSVQGQPVGQLQMGNDSTHLHFRASTDPSRRIIAAYFYVGDCNQIPVTSIGQAIFFQYPIQDFPSPSMVDTVYTYSIPLAGLAACNCISVYFEFSDVDANGNPLGVNLVRMPTALPIGQQAFGINYCTQTCVVLPPPPPPVQCQLGPGSYHTRLQFAYGLPPTSKSPSQYLYQNFAAAFPNGLSLGCSGGHSLNLTTASAIACLLPMGGPAKALTSSLVNPTKAQLNSLFIGEVMALSLNVGFDAHNPALGSSGAPLASLVVNKGAYLGWTVQQVLDEANQVVGGCKTLTNQQFAALALTVSGINLNFWAGKVDKGWLSCPQPVL